jgi:hypothetical protein
VWSSSRPFLGRGVDLYPVEQFLVEVLGAGAHRALAAPGDILEVVTHLNAGPRTPPQEVQVVDVTDRRSPLWPSTCGDT